MEGSELIMVNRRRIIMISNSSQTIHGTWEDLFHAIDTKTYTTKYQIGEIQIIILK